MLEGGVSNLYLLIESLNEMYIKYLWLKISNPSYFITFKIYILVLLYDINVFFELVWILSKSDLQMSKVVIC